MYHVRGCKMAALADAYPDQYDCGCSAFRRPVIETVPIEDGDIISVEHPFDKVPNTPPLKRPVNEP